MPYVSSAPLTRSGCHAEMPKGFADEGEAVPPPGAVYVRWRSSESEFNL